MDGIRTKIPLLGALFRKTTDLDTKTSPSKKTASDPPQHSITVFPPTVDRDLVLKIVVIGGHKVGKTSIVRRYVQDIFTIQHVPTIGVDITSVRAYQSVYSDLPPIIRIQFLDVAHPEVTGTHHKYYFKQAAAVVIVFDPRDLQSVMAVDQWRSVVARHVHVDTPLVLLANKSDTGKMKMKPDDLDQYVSSGGFRFWASVSSRSGHSVREAVDRLVGIVLEAHPLRRRSGTSPGNEPCSPADAAVSTSQSSPSSGPNMARSSPSCSPAYFPTPSLSPSCSPFSSSYSSSFLSLSFIPLSSFSFATASSSSSGSSSSTPYDSGCAEAGMDQLANSAQAAVLQVALPAIQQALSTSSATPPSADDTVGESLAPPRTLPTNGPPQTSPAKKVRLGFGFRNAGSIAVSKTVTGGAEELSTNSTNSLQT